MTTTHAVRSGHVELSRRVRQIREELYGEAGGPLLAEELGVPARTWLNYESGVVIPAPVILRFLEVTGADPTWLRTGNGDGFVSAWTSRPAGHPGRGVGP